MTKSPTTRLLLLGLLLCIHPASALTAPSDVAALLSLLHAVGPSSIPPTSCLATWNFSSDPCRPSSPTHFTCGLTCNPSFTRITALSLDPAGYSAALPTALFKLSLLSHLHLPSNSFRSPLPLLPPSLVSLDLSSNSLSGALPTHLSTLTNLLSLVLSSNSLSGTIPPIFSSLTNLAILDLSYNLLSGRLPAHIPPSLIQLSARRNSLSGPLMFTAFSTLRKLEVLDLSVNKLGPSIEGWFFELPSLQQVDLANNSLTTVEVRGPSQRLVALDLGYNMITGELPRGLAKFPALAALSVRHNRLRGEIPWEYTRGKKGVAMKRLFLDGNFLKGTVPPELLREDVRGSVGDNCLDGCTMVGEMCSPVQKPRWVCRQVYGGGGSKVWVAMAGK